MATATLEERVTELEREMAQVKARNNGARYGVTGKTNPQLIEKMFGIFANDPEAEEVARNVAEERERDREQARQESGDAAG